MSEILLQRTGTIVCRLYDAHCRRVGSRYDWELLEESPGFDCQPLDAATVDLWRTTIADELQSDNIRYIDSVFIKELMWLKHLYLNFAVGRLQSSEATQLKTALWMIEANELIHSLSIKFVMERDN